MWLAIPNESSSRSASAHRSFWHARQAEGASKTQLLYDAARTLSVAISLRVPAAATVDENCSRIRQELRFCGLFYRCEIVIRWINLAPWMAVDRIGSANRCGDSTAVDGTFTNFHDQVWSKC